MLFNDIEVGKQYLINYIDENYPCHCSCHNPGSHKIHCFPCCRDHSFHGIAVCVRKANGKAAFILPPKAEHSSKLGLLYYIVNAEDVVKLVMNDNMGIVDLSDCLKSGDLEFLLKALQ